MTASIGLLVKLGDGAPSPPQGSAHGRAALALREEGIEVVFGEEAEGGRLTGYAARPSGWTRVERAAIAAAYDRYPFGPLEERHLALCAALGPIPVANPPALAALCRDKVALQRALCASGVPMPEIETDPSRFEARLREWGSAFVKPRHGSFGRGVVYLEAGDSPAAAYQRDRDGPRFLQRAVAPPAGVRGACIRILAQREPDGGWLLTTPVAITSGTDRVASAERGADVAPAAEVWAPAILERAGAVARQVCELLARLHGPLCVELGLDLTPEAGGEVQLLEVNGQPRGRLERLATREPARFGTAHLEACCRPLRLLAGRFSR